MLRLKVIRESPFKWLPPIGIEFTAPNSKRWLTRPYTFPDGGKHGPYCQLVGTMRNHKRLSKKKLSSMKKPPRPIEELKPNLGEDLVTATFRVRRR